MWCALQRFHEWDFRAYVEKKRQAEAMRKDFMKRQAQVGFPGLGFSVCQCEKGAAYPRHVAATFTHMPTLLQHSPYERCRLRCQLAPLVLRHHAPQALHVHNNIFVSGSLGRLPIPFEMICLLVA